MMMYSSLGYPCKSTEQMVCSMNCPWLYDGVTILTRGQDSPPSTVSWFGPAAETGVHLESDSAPFPS